MCPIFRRTCDSLNNTPYCTWSLAGPQCHGWGWDQMKNRNCLANPPSLYFNKPLQVTVEQCVAPAPQEHRAKEALEGSGVTPVTLASILLGMKGKSWILTRNRPKRSSVSWNFLKSGKMQPHITDPIYPPVTQSISRLDFSHPGSKRLSLSSGLPRAVLSIHSNGTTPKGKKYSPDQEWNGIPNVLIVPGGPPTYPVHDGNLGSIPR